MHFQQLIEGMVGPALLMVFGACAKYLRDISRDVSAMKVAMGISTERLDSHSHRLNGHDDRLRDLESSQGRGYVS